MDLPASVSARLAELHALAEGRKPK
jgi:hypothetical protein